MSRIFLALTQLCVIRPEAPDADAKIEANGGKGAAVRPFGEHEKTATPVDKAQKKRITKKEPQILGGRFLTGFPCRMVTNGSLIKYSGKKNAIP
jgi:hypothetical protein